jgi:hypothetical protein
LDLTLLAPEIQEHILLAESVDGIEPISERTLRTVVKSTSWSEQRRALALLIQSQLPSPPGISADGPASNR